MVGELPRHVERLGVRPAAREVHVVVVHLAVHEAGVDALPSVALVDEPHRGGAVCARSAGDDEVSPRELLINLFQLCGLFSWLYLLSDAFDIIRRDTNSVCRPTG